MVDYLKKYFKYKNKYINLKNQLGGNDKNYDRIQFTKFIESVTDQDPNSQNINNTLKQFLLKKPLVFIDFEFISIKINSKKYSAPFKYGLYIIKKGNEYKDKNKHIKLEGYIKSSKDSFINVDKNIITNFSWLFGHFKDLYDKTKKHFSYKYVVVNKLNDTKTCYNTDYTHMTLQELYDMITIYNDCIFIGQNIETDLLAYQSKTDILKKNGNINIFGRDYLFSPTEIEQFKKNKRIIDIRDLSGYSFLKNKEYNPIGLSKLTGKLMANYPDISKLPIDDLNLAHSSPLADCAFSANVIYLYLEKYSIPLFNKDDALGKYQKKKNII